MIYGPSRFCFIHIPRSAGVSITDALAKACSGTHDYLAYTGPELPHAHWLHRHVTAQCLSPYIPDWNDIYRFAVVRDVYGIIESQVKLVERDREQGKHNDVETNEGWREILNCVDPRERFAEQWATYEDPVKFWCNTADNKSLGVDLIPFNELQMRWSEICDKCKVKFTPLPWLNHAQRCSTF